MEWITAFYRDRYLTETVLVPSARFGLYAIASEVFRPGDKVLISPVTCHTVMQSLLAAGVTPVFVNLELQTGNIDTARLTPELLREAQGIISTNLYGNPDAADDLQRIAQKYGLFFIEDCAHVLRTRLQGKPIGTFGDASVFSFKKYFGELGGMVTLRESGVAERVRTRVARESFQPAAREEVLRLWQYRLLQSGSGPLAGGLAAVYRRLRRLGEPAPADNGDVEAGAAEPGIDSVHKTLPTTAALSRVADLIARYDELADDRQRKAQALIRECPLPLRKSPRSEDVCYLSVPFSSSRRDAVLGALNQRGIPCYFTYRVPMNRMFAGRAITAHLDESIVEQWCAQILPIDVRQGAECLAAIAAVETPASRTAEANQP